MTATALHLADLLKGLSDCRSSDVRDFLPSFFKRDASLPRDIAKLESDDMDGSSAGT